MFDSISSSLEKVFESFSAERFQYLVYLGVSLVVFCFTIVLNFSERQVFQRFLGSIDPLAAFIIVIVVGFMLLSFLLKNKWFDIFEKGFEVTLINRSFVKSSIFTFNFNDF